MKRFFSANLIGQRMDANMRFGNSNHQTIESSNQKEPN